MALLRLEAVAAARPLAADAAALTPLRPDWLQLEPESAAT
jgi:hypothetical protein